MPGKMKEDKIRKEIIKERVTEISKKAQGSYYKRKVTMKFIEGKRSCGRHKNKVE